MIRLVDAIRIGNTEIKLKDNMKDVAQKAVLIGSSLDAMTLKPLPTSNQIDPGIAVIRAWASVETAIERLTKKYQNKFSGTPPRATRHRIDLLSQAGIINDQLAGVLRDMNGARNMIAHGQDLALHYETVKLFEETASYVESLVEYLEQSRPDT